MFCPSVGRQVLLFEALEQTMWGNPLKRPWQPWSVVKYILIGVENPVPFCGCHRLSPRTVAMIGTKWNGSIDTCGAQSLCFSYAQISIKTTGSSSPSRLNIIQTLSPKEYCYYISTANEAFITLWYNLIIEIRRNLPVLTINPIWDGFSSPASRQCWRTAS